MIGYSGRDFDICPELADAEVNVIWLQRTNTLQPRAEFVLEKRRGMLLIGDLWDFIGVLTGDPMPADQPRMGGRSDFDFGKESVSQWGRQILDWMACSTLMEDLAPEPSWDQSKTLVERASVLGHAGRYLDACHVLQQITRDISLSREELISAEIRAAEQWFIYGSYWRGWRMLCKVEAELRNRPKPSDLHVMAAELRLFMHTAPAFLAKTFRLRRLSEFMQQKSEASYRSARPALENGAWRRLALLRRHAEQIGIPQSSNFELPLKEVFASLGLVLLDVVSKRDSVRSGAMTPEKYTIALDCIKKSDQYGWHP